MARVERNDPSRLKKTLTKEQLAVRGVLESDLWEFAQYINPHYCYSPVHRELFYSMADERVKDFWCLLMSRGHLKSHMMAVYALWRIVNDPSYSILYVTADAALGEFQLSAIKAMIETDQFFKLWPDHFHKEEGRRTMWNSSGITCDHPLKALSRDPSISVKTVKAAKTGRHPHEVILDDIVVMENAYTQSGRAEVALAAAGIIDLLDESVGLITAVGTVYHPDDQFSVWRKATQELYDDKGNVVSEEPQWQFVIKVIEDEGDGTGNYIWPRTYSPVTKKWYGWDINTRAKKYGAYKADGNLRKFWAQYYMVANSDEEQCLDKQDIQYIDPRHLKLKGNRYYFAGRPLNMVMAMDTSDTGRSDRNVRSSDFTAVGVTACDPDGNKYQIDLWQDRTTDMKELWTVINGMRRKWKCTKLHIEKIRGVNYLANYLREQVKALGEIFKVITTPPPNKQSKEERHESNVYSVFRDGKGYIREDGLFLELENQMTLSNPTHDDLLDVVTIGFTHVTKPKAARAAIARARIVNNHNSRFGGK